MAPPSSVRAWAGWIGQGSWEPPAGGRPVVVVSMGTTVNSNADFFRECCAAFAHAPWHVVMTLGGAIDPADLAPVPPNVELRSWIPQLMVLGHATAFVTAGGLGSVTMALHERVSMVVAPQIPECKVVVHRVAALGLGTAIPSAEATGAPACGSGGPARRSRTESGECASERGRR
jgi:MGT family glycosyltransferase